MDELIEIIIFNLKLTQNLLVSFREKSLCNQNFPRKDYGKGLKQIIAGKSLVGFNISANNNQKGVLKVSAVGEHGFVKTENKILEDQSSFLEKYKVQKNDVLITRANTTELVGRVCLVESDYPNLMLSDKTLKLDLIDNLLDFNFVVEVLKSSEVRQQIESCATGTGGAMKNISQNELKSLKIPFPNIQIQSELVKQLRIILKNKRIVENYSAKSQSLQKSLINQIF
jgi:type I restriction enzyme, S subunit